MTHTDSLELKSYSIIYDSLFQLSQPVFDVAFEYREGNKLKTQRRAISFSLNDPKSTAKALEKHEPFEYGLSNADYNTASQLIDGKRYSFCLSMYGSALEPYNESGAQLVLDTLPLDSLQKKKSDLITTYKVGHLFYLGKTLYKFSEVVRDGSWFRLEKAASNSENVKKYRDTLLSKIAQKPEFASPSKTGSVEPDKPQTGFIPMAFKRMSIDGKEIDSKKFAQNSKYTLLVFWGTWCGPCRAEIPYLKDLDGAFGSGSRKTLQIIGIAQDKAEMVRPFAKEYRMPWPQIVVSNNDSLIKGYHIDGYPTVFLIGPDWKVVFSSQQQQISDENIAVFIAKQMKAEKEFRKYVLTGNAELHGDLKAMPFGNSELPIRKYSFYHF